MKKFLSVLCVCAAFSLTACTAQNDEEKGRIEQFTDGVARDATDAVHRPLDKARGVQDIARQRNAEMELKEADGEDEEW